MHHDWERCALLAVLPLFLGACTLIPSPLPLAMPLPLSTDEPGGPSYAHVLFVGVYEESAGTWRFEVTVQHADEGEEHYADRWEVLIPLADGQFLRYTRELVHPHVGEQPFTRSLAGIEVPAGVTDVTVRAHDSRDGYGGREIVVNLTSDAGPGYRVVRK